MEDGHEVTLIGRAGVRTFTDEAEALDVAEHGDLLAVRGFNPTVVDWYTDAEEAITDVLTAIRDTRAIRILPGARETERQLMALLMAIEAAKDQASATCT